MHKETSTANTQATEMPSRAAIPIAEPIAATAKSNCRIVNLIPPSYRRPNRRATEKVDGDHRLSVRRHCLWSAATFGGTVSVAELGHVENLVDSSCQIGRRW